MRNNLFVIGFCFFICLANGQEDSYRDRKVDSMINLLKSQKDTTLILTYRAIFSSLASRDANKGKPYLDSALARAKYLDNTKIQARLITDLGYYNYQMGQHDDAIQYFKQAIDSYASIDYKPMLQLNYNSLGISQKYVGDFEGAMKSYLKSLEISEELGDTEDYMAPTYMNLGQLHAQWGNIELSNKYYRITEEICEKFNLYWGLAITRSNLATNLSKEGNFSEALNLYLDALGYFEEKKDLPEMGEQYNLIGDTYFQMDSIIQAKDHYEKALNISNQILEKGMFIVSSRNLGKVYLNQKNYNKALYHFNESLKESIDSSNMLEMVKVYPQLAKTYAGLGDHKTAYEFSQIHFKKYDSIFKKEKIEDINKLEVKHQTEKKEAEIALQKEEISTLNEKAKVNKLTKGLYAGGMVSALALFGLSVFGYRQRIKKNRIARDKQNEIYKKEIEHKKKELASQTLHLVQKNTFIQELMENLENIKNSPEKFKMEFRRIVMLLKKENASDKDWEVFKTYFAEVHNDFDQKLKTLYADISEKEIRLAAFLRMNLTTKEIATTLNVLPDSILKSKYRLKKKLNLDKETDLTTFLNTL